MDGGNIAGEVTGEEDLADEGRAGEVDFAEVGAGEEDLADEVMFEGMMKLLDTS